MKLKHGPPKWFKRFIISEFAKGLNPSYTYSSVSIRDFGLDHPRHFAKIALFAPYACMGSELLPLLTACEGVGLIVDFNGKSFYEVDGKYERTFLIAIYRKEDERHIRDYHLFADGGGAM